MDMQLWLVEIETFDIAAAITDCKFCTALYLLCVTMFHIPIGIKYNYCNRIHT